MRKTAALTILVLLPACTFGESDTPPRDDTSDEDDDSNDDNRDDDSSSDGDDDADDDDSSSDEASDDDATDDDVTSDDDAVSDDDAAEATIDLAALSEEEGFLDVCVATWVAWSEAGCAIAEDAAADCYILPPACEERYLAFLQCTLDTMDCFGGACEETLDAAIECLDQADPVAPTEEPEVPLEPEAPTTPEPEPTTEPAGFAPSPNQGIAIRRLVETVCQLNASCTPLLSELTTGDEAYCLEHYEAVVQASADLPGTALGTAELDACTETLTELSCVEWQTGTFPCELPGTRQNGEACLNLDQCASMWCDTAPYSCGACSDPPGEGDPCDGYWGCPPPMACSEGTCTPLGATGQACDDSSPCYSLSDTCLDGVCVRRDRELGETCGPEQGEPYCIVTGPPFLACDTDTGVCMEAEIAAAGEACPAFGWCGGRSSCVEGTCEPGPEEGDPCDETAGCRWPAECSDGVCKGPSTPYECDGG